MDGQLEKQARAMVRRSLKGALGTLDQTSGAPYVSMVGVATDTAGQPILLLSTLARHTANLAADPRASLLLDHTDASGDPVSGQRLTLTGRLEPACDASVRRRYLARHPSAAVYADFADFSFWRLEIQSGHSIAGFGRIQQMRGKDLRLEPDGLGPFSAGEATLVDDWNAAMPVRLQRLVASLPPAADVAVGQDAGPCPHDSWTITGVDPEGVDLRAGTATSRLSFPGRIVAIAQAGTWSNAM